MDNPSGSGGRKQHGSTGSEKSEALRVWMLGDFKVSVGPSIVGKSAWHLRKATALVKLLSLAPHHRLHRERATELLWPGHAKKAASNNLRQTLHAARRVLDPTGGSRYLVGEDDSLVMCPEGNLWVDVDAFEEAALTARRSKSTAAYRAALDLYAGELLPEDRYEEWVEGRREELRQLHLTLLIELAAFYEERDEYEPAIETLQKAMTTAPTHEQAHLGLMRLHALSGRPDRALSQYERLYNALSRGLGTQPGAETRGLRAEIAAGRFKPTPSAATPQRQDLPDMSKHNLPAPRTRFVGREREMVEATRMLAMTRLLTLTGPGGCGKTRLALEASRDLVGNYPDGVWFVQLAPLSEGTLVPQALATTLRVREQPGRPLLDTLLNALHDAEMLLILDNCEHLTDATARLAHALLDYCPRLRVLATSRELLGVTGEQNWLVPSLSTPGAQQSPTVDELEGYESAQLFADRASIRCPGFELTPENATAVAKVCARLEGIPLAIELAAASVGILSAEQISERLGHSLNILTGGERIADPRHRTLRATLDWSHQLLSKPEQVLFRRLSVYAGGFTLEAAEATGAGGVIEQEDVLDLLSMLVDKSLVVAEESWQSGSRYRLLEPIRQYSREKLKDGEEEEQTRYRHAEWYLALAEEADNESSGSGHSKWLHRLETEHDNLRAALDWSQEEGDAELALRLAGALWLFWFTRGYSIEGRGWLEKALSLGRSPVARAKALNGAGWIAMFQGDFDTAKTVLEESLTLYRELNDEEGIASSLSFLGHVALLGHRDDIPVAALLEEALALRPRLKNRRTIANMLVTAGIAAGLLRGDLGEAAALFEEARALYREMGDRWGIITCQVNLGLISVILEHHDRTKVLLREVIQLSRELDEKVGSVYSFFGLASAAASEGYPVRAARLWGISEAMREAAGIQIMPSTYTVTSYESRLAEARTRLGEAAFEDAWAEGKAMGQQQAVEYAFSEEDTDQPTTFVPEESLAGAQRAALSPREQEVALLAAQGLTNRQISSRLRISERTAGNHVAKILLKLGLNSRAQIVIWVTEHQLLKPHKH
jgi:predicted ATPase/DNA-binding SARP family transcriptional activator/DNA-binding CsgD family transcriptional regulator